MRKESRIYRLLICISFMFSFICSIDALQDDIYIIFYITSNGVTGHVGMAVDNYNYYSSEGSLFGEAQYDSIKNHTLTYYDLWGPSSISWDEHNTDFIANYNELPESSTSPKLDVDQLLNEGIPHKYSRPFDAMIRISTSPYEDHVFRNLVEQVMLSNTSYNTRNYNCTDFVIKCLEKMFQVDFVDKEFIPFSWSSTPNTFYKELISKVEVEIIRDPGNKVNYSFFKERIIKSF